MVTLNFTLSPEAAAKVHDLLVCLAKFSDTVAIEARQERFTFTALNSSKSAYSACTLNKNFFSKYECVPDGGRSGRFTCSMYTKALLSVFKSRMYDPTASGRDGTLQRCEAHLQDSPSQTSCRLIIRMICNPGIIKTYKLTYAPVEVMHALFDRQVAKNTFSMHASAMREYIEYFGTKTEMLDIYSGEQGDGRAVFKSYTEKIANGTEILKHPLVTAVAVNISDFEEFAVQPGLHIIISVKDFKAIVTHADTLRTTLKVYYSQPTRPLQFTYGDKRGMVCEFTLMTSGDISSAPRLTTPVLSRANSRATTTTAPERVESRAGRSDMPPPEEPVRRSTRRTRQPGQRQPEAARAAPHDDGESLFIPMDEEDRQWEPADFNQDPEEMLGWDASIDHNSTAFPTFRDSGTLSRTETEESTEAIAPTQKISQIKGLW